MPPPIPIGTVFYDALSSFEGGVNQGASPLILPPHTMAECLNVTVRGDFVGHRPPYQVRAFTDAGGLMASAFSQGTFQGAAYYKPDAGFESLMASIAGRLFQFQIAGNAVTLSEQTLGEPQLATASQAWMWQSEKWLIWQDGVSNPNFWDGSAVIPTMMRSDYGTSGAAITTTATVGFTTAGVGFPPVVPFSVSSVSQMNVGDVLTIDGLTYTVSGISGLNLTLSQATGISDQFSPAGQPVNWSHQYDTLTTTNFVTPGTGSSVVVGFTSVANLVLGDVITIVAGYTFSVTDITGLNVTILQQSGLAGVVANAPIDMMWSHAASTASTIGFISQGVGNAPLVQFTLSSVDDLSVDDIITISTFGDYTVTSLQTLTQGTGLLQLTGTSGNVAPAGETVTFHHIGQQLRPGKMGTYGMGRNVYALGVKSLAKPATSYNTATVTGFTVPAVGVDTIIVQVADGSNMLVGDIITIGVFGTFRVSQAFPFDFIATNLTGTPSTVVASGQAIAWSHLATPFIPAGQNFLFGDIVYGSSGTVQEDHRDAVLYETENDFINGGGLFTVPSNSGEIRAMRFLANLDQSLGQGPLQVFTVSTVFSCNVPVDRLTWQSLTNPILTESLISNGAQAQDSVQLVNGDAVFRSIDGIRSLILGRRDFTSWGNVPASFEVRDILAADDPALLIYGSSTVFDNRYLITTTPQSTDQGVTHTGLIALNLDPISSLRGKAQSVYDGAWGGLNIFKIITGQFQGVERCFAFCWDDTLSALNLVELLPTVTTQTKDNGTDDIVWEFTTASLKFGQDDPRQRELLQLDNGEIYLDELTGTVRVQAFYKPDQYPIWVPWSDFTETNTGGSPGFRPRIGLGQPSPTPCDVGNNRPLRQGFTYQFKFIITGDCVFLGGRFKAVSVPQSEFAKVSACQT